MNRGLALRLGLVALIIVTIDAVIPAHAQMTPTPRPVCEPAPDGTGTRAHVVDSAAGTWSVWFCPSEFEWRWQALMSAAGYRIKFPTPEARAGKTPVEIYRLAWDLNVTTPVTDPSIAPLYVEARAWALANIPAPPMFVVRSNGTTPTRPSYVRVSATAIGAAAPARATVGASCACAPEATRAKVGTTLYCPFYPAGEFIPGTLSQSVAVCVRAP